MRELITEDAVAKMINEAPIGKELNIQFSGMPSLIDVEFKFFGGWIVKQSVPPGAKLTFTKGDERYLEGISITINEYQGMKPLKGGDE